MICFLAFALPLGLCFRFPSCLWNFDGVACAAALELGDPVFFFHSNHLLYGFLGYWFWRALFFFSSSIRALSALQLLNPLLSAIGLAGVYRIFLHETRQPWTALGLTWAMSVSAVFWVWSLEAQVYPLGFAALAWAVYVLLASQSTRKYLWVGLLHGLAVLGHVIHLLWIIPALYWIRKERVTMTSFPAVSGGESRQHDGSATRLADARSVASPTKTLGDDGFKTYLTYLATLGSTVAIPYLSVLFFVLIPSHRGFPWILTWLRGSAGLTPDRHLAWHWAGWNAPLQWAWGNLPYLWGSFSPYGTTHVTFLTWTLTVVSLGLFGLGIFLSFRHRADRIWRFSLLWIGVYALFLWTWEPRTLLYRMADVIPLGLLLAVGLARGLSETTRRWCLAGLVGSTLAVNFVTLIRPMHAAKNNAAYQQTLALARGTPSDAFYLMEGGVPWIYLLYFTGRPAWNVTRIPSDLLKTEVTKLKQRAPVFAHESLLQEPMAHVWMRTYRLRKVVNLPWVELL
ncbi:MAG: hypothetical protein WC859_00960 [Elusimicrobiota bacterium]